MILYFNCETSKFCPLPQGFYMVDNLGQTPSAFMRCDYNIAPSGFDLANNATSVRPLVELFYRD